MHPRGLLAVIESLTDDFLAVAVGVEVYRTGWHHAYQVWAKPFVERAPSFHLWNGKEDLEGFADVERGASGDGEGRQWRNATGGAGGREMGLVEV